MKASQLFIRCLLLALLTGCRSGGNTELLERELRLQEDRICQLESCLCDYEATIDAGRRENQSLKDQLYGADRGFAPEPVPKPSRGTPRGGYPNAPPATPLAPPEINLGPGGGAPGSSGNSVSPPSTDDLQIPTVEVPGDPAKGARSSRQQATPDANPVRIVLNRRLTGAVNTSYGPQSDGVSVVFEPRDAKGKYVPAMGDVSVVVLDPNKQGAASRVARWDFTADEAAGHLKKTALGQGYHFDLPWSSQPPNPGKLQLFVRLMTPHGQKLVTQMPLGVSEAGLAKRQPAAQPTVAAKPEASAGASDWTQLSETTRSAMAEERAAAYIRQASADNTLAESRSTAEPPNEAAEQPLVDEWPPARQPPARTRSVVKRAVWSPDR